MTSPDGNEDWFRDLAFAAADLLVTIDAQGVVLRADGDASMLHHPSAERLIGKNALELISEGDSRRLRDDLWALGPGRRLAWDDILEIEGQRRILVQRDPRQTETFNLLVSRTPRTNRIRANRADDILVERFRDAVMNGRLKAALQPVVETRTGAVSHHEVLARFDGEESPVNLITAAERSGQICHLDYIMIDAGAHRLAQNPDPSFRLAVNISGESLQRYEVVEELCAVIAGHAFGRTRMIVEITESAEIEDIEMAARGVNKLRSSGVSVSLDDFGAGAASFNYLRALDVDGLKFDGSFLTSSPENSRNSALMRSIARMCLELGIASVGERVETEQDRKALQYAGVRFAQGYLFGTPEIYEGFFSRRRPGLRGVA